MKSLQEKRLDIEDIEIEKSDQERGEIKIRVLGAPIRGADWTLTRILGTGTYATIAGVDDDDDDQHLVIEEWNDPTHRAIWDNLDNLEAVEAAYKDIVRTLQEEEEELKKERKNSTRNSVRPGY